MKSDGPQGGKEVMIRGLMNEYREQAKRELLDEYPDLAADVANKQQAQQALKLGNLGQ